ncbi:glutaminase [Ruegeria sp. PrR005]|uniref:glutaminase n=1 Tax=Ruegeria sp. PrR005 TaxID=2706882 RepID=UPI00351A0FC9
MGLPGQSGVGVGILVIAPGRVSVAVWSPGLNQHRDSARGSLAVEPLAQETGWLILG